MYAYSVLRLTALQCLGSWFALVNSDLRLRADVEVIIEQIKVTLLYVRARINLLAINAEEAAGADEAPAIEASHECLFLNEIREMGARHRFRDNRRLKLTKEGMSTIPLTGLKTNLASRILSFAPSTVQRSIPASRIINHHSPRLMDMLSASAVASSPSNDGEREKDVSAVKMKEKM
ncbi:hypothetical protein FRC12_011535 [Ceratobasidium sp. 428]|nr:hypothetical protein FRC12_011535 [Ceratobasidium sp. 428]